MNEVDNQVRVAHKILGYHPIQKSFLAPKYMIRAKDPRLHRITNTEHEFLLPEGSPVPEDAPLAGPSSSHQAVEVEGGRVESEEQVTELGQSKDEFGVFDQVNLSEDPSGDLGDLSLTEVDLLSIGTSSQAEMGFKRKPPTSLLDLIEGQPGKHAPRKPQSKFPPFPPKPQPVQTRSSSTQSKPSSPQSKLPPPPQSTLPPRPKPADPKRKRASKGKDPMDGGRSRSSKEEDEI